MIICSELILRISCGVVGISVRIMNHVDVALGANGTYALGRIHTCNALGGNAFGHKGLIAFTLCLTLSLASCLKRCALLVLGRNRVVCISVRIMHYLNSVIGHKGCYTLGSVELRNLIGGNYAVLTLGSGGNRCSIGVGRCNGGHSLAVSRTLCTLCHRSKIICSALMGLCLLGGSNKRVGLAGLLRCGLSEQGLVKYGIHIAVYNRTCRGRCTEVKQLICRGNHIAGGCDNRSNSASVTLLDCGSISLLLNIHCRNV